MYRPAYFRLVTPSAAPQRHSPGTGPFGWGGKTEQSNRTIGKVHRTEPGLPEEEIVKIVKIKFKPDELVEVEKSSRL